MPLPLTVSCFSKIQISFTFLVRSPGQSAIKRACVRACVCCYYGHSFMLTDAMMILTAPPPDNWKRQLGHIHITWLNTLQCDLRAYNLTLNDAVDQAQNRPLYRLMSAYGATHSLWCMPDQKNTKLLLLVVPESLQSSVSLWVKSLWWITLCFCGWYQKVHLVSSHLSRGPWVLAIMSVSV